MYDVSKLMRKLEYYKTVEQVCNKIKSLSISVSQVTVGFYPVKY